MPDSSGRDDPREPRDNREGSEVRGSQQRGASREDAEDALQATFEQVGRAWANVSEEPTQLWFAGKDVDTLLYRINRRTPVTGETLFSQPRDVLDHLGQVLAVSVSVETGRPKADGSPSKIISRISRALGPWSATRSGSAGTAT
jgi:hypothetical protein